VAENIVINFEANTQGLQSTIDLLEKLGQVDKKTADEFRKATAEYDKQRKAADQLGDEVQDLGKKSEDTGKKVKKSQSEMISGFNQLANSIKTVGAAIGIAFGVTEVIRFGVESVKAFRDAEKTAKQLNFALTKVGNEGAEAFDRLIKQSEEFEGFFSDDDIQKTQTVLLQFGLTSNEIDKLIPKVIDLATATGTDLATATDLVIQGINGQTRALKPLGLEFEDTGNKAENLAIITEKLTKFQGAHAEVLETSEGRARALSNAFNNLQEDIGDFLLSIGEGFLIAGKIASAFFDKIFPDAAKEIQSQNDAFREWTDGVKKSLEDAGQGASDLGKKLIKEQDITIKTIEGQIQGLRDRAKASGDAREKIALADAANKVEKTNLENEKTRLNILKQLVDQDTKLGSTLGAKEFKSNLQDVELALTRIPDGLNEFINQNIALDKVSKDYWDQLMRDVDLAGKNLDEFHKNQADAAKAESEQNKKTLDEERELNKKKIELAAATANEIFNISQALFNSNIQNLETEQDAILKQYDDQLAALEETRDKERITEARFNNEKKELIKQREKFELDSQKKINEEKRKADIANRAQKVFQITIETARAIAESSPNPVLIALAAALGAAQLATVLATPLPKYKKGTLSVGGIDTGQDTQLAMLRPGEAVIPTETNKAYHPAIKAIYEGRISAKDMNSFVSMKLKGGDIKNSFALDYDLLAKKLGNEMAWQLRGSNNVNIKNVQDFAKALNSGYDFRRMI